MEAYRLDYQILYQKSRDCILDSDPTAKVNKTPPDTVTQGGGHLLFLFLFFSFLLGGGPPEPSRDQKGKGKGSQK